MCGCVLSPPPPPLSELIGVGQEVHPPSNMSSAADLLKQGAGERLAPRTDPRSELHWFKLVLLLRDPPHLSG